MSTMSLAEKSAARRPEPHLPAQSEQPAVRLLLIDERLERGIDDLDFPPQTCQPKSAGNEIIAKIDDRTCHGIAVPNPDIMVN
jgi:hypothetical protein